MNFAPSASPSRFLGEHAYETLRDSIITLQLEPGQGIHENELAESLRISRTPIRDAIHLLHSERLIEILPQRTKQVACISESKVKESSLVRLSLESTAFKLTAMHWDQSDKYRTAEREINRNLQEQLEAAENQDVALFLQLDEAFHRIILKLTGNETLLEVVYHMRAHLNRFRFLAMKELALTSHLVEEHEQLFQAIKSRDADRVLKLLEHHLGKLDTEIPLLRSKFPHYFRD
ncbi:GntR family transcriptional regulator [Cohnella silvisoli]|uniref:GntR family transcriptional regulator n=1 Tax=Cohnella silvisoli TaxID=2873699 RepID=A0ABV1L3A6_9BACL|nr:GntR family transcriptional regulator [Cohnella silvisoli]MCD9026161.1 GntR family transcriptional regulator [Cohnella silvisoli]